MRCALRRFSLTKAVPLAISRGTTATVDRLLLTVEHDGVTGWGEAGGVDTGHRSVTTGAIATELEALLPTLETLHPEPRQSFDALLAPLSPPARWAVDLALLDWWGKRLDQPLGRLWGLDHRAVPPTSVTLGLGTVEAVLDRLEQWWRQLPATRIKLKLGSPAGLEHDQALVQGVRGALARQADRTGVPCELQVDANGGWDRDGARARVGWLAEQGVVLVEQPLPPQVDPEADCAAFADLELVCPISLVADESCWNLSDVVRLAPFVDGVNIKMLKSGGLSEALLMACTARRLGLEVMLGCYSDSALLNGAAAQLLPLVTWPDLDSHLNLLDDPFLPPPLTQDVVRASLGAGLGVLPDPNGVLGDLAMPTLPPTPPC